MLVTRGATLLRGLTLQSRLEARQLSNILPPLFLLPSQARFFNSTSSIVDGDKLPDPLSHSQAFTSEPISKLDASETGQSSPQPPQSTSQSSTLSDTVKTLLPLLKAQQSHYVTAHIYGRPYLVTAGDTVRLPFLMHGVNPGDVLRLNRAANIGSRDYTLKGEPYIDERLFECRARVMGVEAEPLRIKEKTKRRQRRVKHVRSKHKYTILKISELKIKSLSEIGP